MISKNEYMYRHLGYGQVVLQWMKECFPNLLKISCTS